jgi:hypothetical protein
LSGCQFAVGVHCDDLLIEMTVLCDLIGRCRDLEYDRSRR